MPMQTWRQIIATQQAAGTLFATYTTAKSVINPQAVVTLPANYFTYAGQQLRVSAAGGISNIVTTPGTMNFQVKVGNVVAFDTGQIQLNATAHTTLPFWIDILLTCQAVGNGTTGKLMGQAILGGIMFTLTAAQVDAVNTSGLFMVPATAPAQGTGFDTTVANTLDLWVGFSISNGGNGIQVAQYQVSSEN